nr:MAG TPA: hypothetical protein [Bacteriophage sp.]
MITKEQVKEILTKKSGRNYKRRVEICFWHILPINQRI